MPFLPDVRNARLLHRHRGVCPTSPRHLALVGDASHLRDIAKARQARDAAVERLAAAVAAAREAGDSWTMIGIALGTSKQNAFRKYGGT